MLFSKILPASNVESTSKPMKLVSLECKIGSCTDVALPSLLRGLGVQVQFTAKVPVLGLDTEAAGAGTFLSRRITALITNLTVFTRHGSANK